MKKKQTKKTNQKGLPKATATDLTLIGKGENQCHAKLQLTNLPKLTDKQALKMVNWLDMVKAIILENRTEWTEKVATFRLMKL